MRSVKVLEMLNEENAVKKPCEIVFDAVLCRRVE